MLSSDCEVANKGEHANQSPKDLVFLGAFFLVLYFTMKVYERRKCVVCKAPDSHTGTEENVEGRWRN